MMLSYADLPGVVVLGPILEGKPIDASAIGREDMFDDTLADGKENVSRNVVSSDDTLESEGDGDGDGDGDAGGNEDVSAQPVVW